MNKQRKECIVFDRTRDAQVYDRELSKEEVAFMYHKGLEMRGSVPIWYKDTKGKIIGGKNE